MKNSRASVKVSSFGFFFPVIITRGARKAERRARAEARTGWAYSRGLINMTGRDDRLDRGKSLAAPGSQRGQLFPAIPARIPRGSVRLWTEKLHNVSAFSRESPRARAKRHTAKRVRAFGSFSPSVTSSSSSSSVDRCSRILLQSRERERERQREGEARLELFRARAIP